MEAPIERLFKAFALENLSIDPNKAILPFRFPLDLPLGPTVEEYWQFRTDWETILDEEHQYLMLMPDLVYSQVWEQKHELDGIRTEIRALRHTMDMVVHNAAVLTKELVAVNEDIIDDLHPETPGSWTATLQEF